MNTPKASLTPIASTDSKRCPAGHGTPSPTSGRRGFSRLLDYVERHGDARVPQSYTVDGYRLGAWVSQQRINYAEGSLDADREEPTRRTYPAGHGTPTPTSGRRVSADCWTTSNATVTPASRCPTRSMATNSARGSACNAAITPKAPLTPIANTDSQELPGWTWDPHADQWEEGFSRLLHYVEHHGHARVP